MRKIQLLNEKNTRSCLFENYWDPFRSLAPNTLNLWPVHLIPEKKLPDNETTWTDVELTYCLVLILPSLSPLFLPSLLPSLPLTLSLSLFSLSLTFPHSLSFSRRTKTVMSWSDFKFIFLTLMNTGRNSLIRLKVGMQLRIRGICTQPSFFTLEKKILIEPRKRFLGENFKTILGFNFFFLLVTVLNGKWHSAHFVKCGKYKLQYFDLNS